jgi:hypothetical protein
MTANARPIHTCDASAMSPPTARARAAWTVLDAARDNRREAQGDDTMLHQPYARSDGP